MNGFNTNFDAEGNQVYAVNTVAFHYVNEPIAVERDRPVRIYLVNILEYDPINSFHIHGNFFNHFPTGTSLTPTEFTDTIIQGQAQRAVLEICFPYSGDFMFHAHKSEFAELGWMGFFRVGGGSAAQAAAPAAFCTCRTRTRWLRTDGGVSPDTVPSGALAPFAGAAAIGGLARAPVWVLAAVPLALIAVAIAPSRCSAARASTTAAARRSRSSRSSAPCCARARSSSTLRNTGPDPVSVAQVAVADAFVTFDEESAGEIGRLESKTITLDYPWQEGSPYSISILTSTGATIDHTIDAAVETPETEASFYGLMTLLGTYVGVIPVLLGMLFMPLLRRVTRNWLTVFMAFTIGLLAFLAVDGFLEGSDIGAAASGRVRRRRAPVPRRRHLLPGADGDRSQAEVGHPRAQGRPARQASACR